MLIDTTNKSTVLTISTPINFILGKWVWKIYLKMVSVL